MKFLNIVCPFILTSVLFAHEAVNDARPAPSNAAEREALVRALEVRPSKPQIAWQKLGVYAFIHFGVNTFTDREWGTGKEDPAIFNPTDLDCRQWVAALKSAGCSMIIITAKHHDGFCLYPSRYTRHSVASSPWKTGKGDVLKEISVACAEAGLKLGVYLSPADLHEIEAPGGRYGNKSIPTESIIPTPVADRPFPAGHRQFHLKVDDYNRYFLNQLYELLTEYGPITEVWFDGANPHSGSEQKYDRAYWFDMIHQLVPDALIAVDGPDIRWIGNEHGHARDVEWSVVRFGKTETHPDLGSRSAILNANQLIWKPGECDVSIRPGWFYHASQDVRVRSPQNLLDLYLASVGRNASLLLNVPPNRSGLISDADINSLKGFGAELRNIFGNQACGAWNDHKPNSANLASSAPAELLDNRPDTVWTPSDKNWSLEFTSRNHAIFLMLEEDIISGQRIEKFTLSQQIDGTWQEIAAGNTVGARRIITIPEVAPNSKLRLEIKASRALPRLTELGLFKSSSLMSQVSISRNKERKLVLSVPDTVGGKIHYTLDGSEPNASSPLFQAPIAFDQGGLVRAVLIKGGEIGPVISQLYGISKANWKILSCSSEDPSALSKTAIDDNHNTFWHTAWRPAKAQPPHEIVIDLGQSIPIHGFTYLPRQDSARGRNCADHYRIYLGDDSSKLDTPVSEGRFENIANNPIEQVIRFGQPITARYLKFVIMKTADGKPEAATAEIGLLGK